MAAFTDAYETLLERLACRSNPVLKVSRVSETVKGNKTHRPIRFLDPHVQLLLAMKTAFTDLGDAGFQIFVALVVTIEIARNSMVAESFCKLLQGRESSLSVSSFPEYWAQAMLGKRKLPKPTDYLMLLTTPRRRLQ